MKKSRRTYNGVHLNKKSNTQDVVEQSLTVHPIVVFFRIFHDLLFYGIPITSHMMGKPGLVFKIEISK